MPTPYGSRGGVAFSADELRVLGGALATALQSDPAPEEARAYLRLAQAMDEAVREGSRLRSFVRADLTRYRDALPGAAAGYLDHLEAALACGYSPAAADLAALGELCARPVGAPEAARRRALLRRAETAARLRVPQVRRPADDHPAGSAAQDEPEPRREEEGEREAEPSPGPAKPGPAERPGSPEPTAPSRPVPTPAEVFPPRRRQSPPEPGTTPETETPRRPETRHRVPA
ncbi:hypothetical protein SALCHL_003822 [Streptomyces albus subsp. chlorinus]|uniref:hypothetical protein n=1 Tax=Streptomyces albus TaxID=1888 RepID=UPI003D11DD34